MLKFLYLIGLFFSFFLMFILFDFIDISNEKMPLLGAIGIIISAFIASASVMKSIKSTKQLKEDEEKNKKIKEIIFIKYILNQMKLEYKMFSSFTSINNMDYNSKETTYYFRLHKYVPKIQKLWEKLVNEKYLIYLKNNTDFQIIYENITELINEYEQVSLNDEKTINSDDNLINAFDSLIEKLGKIN